MGGALWWPSEVSSFGLLAGCCFLIIPWDGLPPCLLAQVHVLAEAGHAWDMSEANVLCLGYIPS